MFPTIYLFNRFNYFITWQIEKSNTCLNVLSFGFVQMTFVQCILIRTHTSYKLDIRRETIYKLLSFFLHSDAFFSNMHLIGKTFTFYWYQLFIFWLYISPILVSIMCLLLYLPIKMCMLPLNCICVPFEINTV